MLWGLVPVGLALLLALWWGAPARTTIDVHTDTGIVRAQIAPIWGLAPGFTYHALRERREGKLKQAFSDVARIGNALMTPGLAEIVVAAATQIQALEPKALRATLTFDLADVSRNRVVQTAIDAALATAPWALRQQFNVSSGGEPGAAIDARIELSASPLRMWSIYARLRDARAAKEFRKRLRRAPKAAAKPPREVRA